MGKKKKQIPQGGNIPKWNPDSRRNNNLPRVGEVVEVEKIGWLLCHYAENGRIHFAGKNGSEITDYAVQREGIEKRETGDYRFRVPPLIEHYTDLSSTSYRRLDRQLRSAKL